MNEERLEEEIYIQLVAAGFSDRAVKGLKESLAKNLKFNSNTDSEVATDLRALGDVLINAANLCEL